MATIEVFLKSVLLPEGYPSSVSDDYMIYQFYDTIQGLMSYLKGCLCATAFLRGIGVGNSDGNIYGAMIVFTIRDATGVLAGLLAGMPTFTKRFSSKSEIKLWRMIAEISRGFAGVFELLSCIYSNWFIPFIVAAATCNSFASVASSCNRAALVTHFARANNIADCAAKEGNQDRAVKLFGIAIAFVFMKQASDNPASACYLYGFITFLHILFNYMAISELNFKDDSKMEKEKVK